MVECSCAGRVRLSPRLIHGPLPESIAAEADKWKTASTFEISSNYGLVPSKAKDIFHT